MPLADPWFWAFLAVVGWALAFGLIGTETLGRRLDVFWPLGWSLLKGSVLGILLTPVWFALVWVGTHIEEEGLVREYGDAYREFQARVPRLLPGLPGRR